ncbi:helicase SNF [Paenibacillus nasutitermitis]|uniref:Helicase SNF n=2 Tax=Paenibacillus nasutitermitis TaxID=1652958 RepID=A0A916ZCN9_9BACL|nr:helicase SNF [Paenibacillus nasutitermitis]
MLGLFGDRPVRPTGTRPLFDTRTVLQVTFIFKPYAYGYGKHMPGIEIRTGTKRLYIVQHIRGFLECIDRRETYVFSGNFTYDPLVHCFQPADDAVLQQLIGLLHQEQLYRESSDAYSSPTRPAGGDRMLLIPPSSWEPLHPLLEAAPAVQVEQEGFSVSGISLSDDKLPLVFQFDEAGTAGYQLKVDGLDPLIVMEAYGIVLLEGRLLKLPAEQCKRLSELKRMLDAKGTTQMQILPQQMEPFMEKVIPGLIKLGTVHISQAVSERMVHSPLKARLYLDRVKHRLLAGLEFQYGDIVMNALETAGQQRGEGRILMRDGEREGQILELMEQSSFVPTEAGYFMEDEEGEYEFLYHIVPQLEKLLQIYATTAVKTRLHQGTPPRIKVELEERTDWLAFTFEMDGIAEAEIRSLVKALEEKSRYYRLPGGALMPLETAEFEEIRRFINETGLIKQDLTGYTFRVPVVHGLYMMDPDAAGQAVKLGRSFRRLLENMRNPDHLDFPVPERLEPVLRDYQKYGFQWMKTLAYYHFGGILADDMGLGKTLQSIAFLVSVLPEIRSGKQPAIIVCPSSLVYNWQNELKKFAPEIRSIIADGPQAGRFAALKKASRTDVLITSYPLLRRDIEVYAAQSFHTLILDEAQTFKNHFTQTAQAVKGLAAQYRFALTGTPIENHLEELWSIFDVVFPGLFKGLRTFQDLSRDTVAKRVRPFLLRRLKSDVLKELPEKIESVQASKLLPEQKKLYAAYLAQLQEETLKHLNDDSFQKHRIKILAGLTRLRQLCCHPALFVEDYKGSSAKFEQLLDIIEECRSSGKRMLVFSQFTKMLELIGRELGYQGVPFFYLDGQTPSSERVDLCSRFNEGERDLFLISLKAGGTGLNLTGADTVILYDLWWNPAVEQQAADRAHRIGQKKVVQVIRLVAQGTVEDKMFELQQKKKNLIDEVIQPGQEALSTLTEQDVRDLLMMNGNQ